MDYYKVMLDLSDNEKEVLNIVQKKGPVSIAALTEKLHTTRSKLQALLDSLVGKNLICESGFSDSTGGRRSVLYDVNCNDFFFAGISIGSVRYGLCISDFKNRVITGQEFSMSSDITPMDFVFENSVKLRRMATEYGIPYEKIIGLGVAITGAVDRKNCVLLRQEADSFHASWVGTPLKPVFETAFDKPVNMDVHMVCEAIKHYNYADGRDSKRLLLVSAGMSLGACLIDRGKVLRNLDNTSDAFAHMIIDIDGRKCSCGNYGCLDCYSSARAILKQVSAKIKSGVKSKIDIACGSASFSDIADAAREGDSLAVQETEYAASVMGVGLSNVIKLINPDTVVLFGLVAFTLPGYTEEVFSTVRKRLYGAEKNFLTEVNLIQASSDARIGDDGTAMFIEKIVYLPTNIQP